MSCNYADGLSPYHDKGQLGLEEKFDSKSTISTKVDTLAKWIRKANHVVIHTGAGISTSAGIPDFRGPKGVWTLQEKGVKPDLSTDFNDATPTPTHMAITQLVELGKVKYVVSQNIDGLHLRSGLPRKFLSELHGNMFVEQCNACNRQFVRNSAVPTVGQKSLNKACPTIKPNGRACRGRLHDTILDWEHNLPENDLAMADFHSCLADLSIALGTTMQIVPSGSLPLYTKKAGGKLVIINLQPTKHDSKADLLIHGYVDDVILKMMKLLSMKIPKYSTQNDPTRLSLSSDKYFEWTISDKATQEMRKIYEDECGSKEAKKRLDMIDDDDVPLLIRVKKRKSENCEQPTTTVKIKKEESAVSDIEVIEETSKKKRGRPPKGQLPIPPTKLTIKKNVTPTKTKYEIVPSRSEKRPSRKSCEIIRKQDNNPCTDLEMICESDDEGPNVFTTNFRRYLYDDKTFKREEKHDIDSSSVAPITVESDSTEIKLEEVKRECENKSQLLDNTYPGNPSEIVDIEPQAVAHSTSSSQSTHSTSSQMSPNRKSSDPSIAENGAPLVQSTEVEAVKTAESKTGKDEPTIIRTVESEKETVKNAESPTQSARNIDIEREICSQTEGSSSINSEAKSKSSTAAAAAKEDSVTKVSDISTNENVPSLTTDVDLPPLNDNLLYGNSDLDLYGNY